MKNVIRARAGRDAPEIIIGTMTICMEPAKINNPEAVESRTPYPASLISMPNAMPMKR